MRVYFVDKYCVLSASLLIHKRYHVMAIKRAILLSASSVFLLTGCGEGYEMVKTNTMFPYGNERTAGSGTAYVLAKMLPKKELKLEPVAKAVERVREPEVVKPAPVVEPKPAPVVPKTTADDLFLDDGKK